MCHSKQFSDDSQLCNLGKHLELPLHVSWSGKNKVNKTKNWI